METTEVKGKAPKYSGDGIAVWENQTKDGKPYLSVKLVGHTAVNAFLVEKKESESADSLLQLLQSGKITMAQYSDKLKKLL